MFGVNDDGSPYIIKFIKRTNSSMKHAGPVTLSLSQNPYTTMQIEVFIGKTKLSSKHTISELCALHLEAEPLEKRDTAKLSVEFHRESAAASRSIKALTRIIDELPEDQAQIKVAAYSPLPLYI